MTMSFDFVLDAFHVMLSPCIYADKDGRLWLKSGMLGVRLTRGGVLMGSINCWTLESLRTLIFKIMWGMIYVLRGSMRNFADAVNWSRAPHIKSRSPIPWAWRKGRKWTELSNKWYLLLEKYNVISFLMSLLLWLPHHDAPQHGCQNKLYLLNKFLLWTLSRW